MLKKVSRNDERMRRHVRVRTKISGTPECPRLNVFRSNSNIHAQIIDDVNGVTLASASSVELKLENGGNVEAAKTVGTEIAKRATDNKNRVLFIVHRKELCEQIENCLLYTSPSPRD